MACSKWFWINSTFLLSAAGVVGWMVCKSENLAQNQSIKVYPELEFTKMKDLEVVRGEVREGYDLQALIAGTPEQLKQGQTVYSAQCAGCHGADHKGNPALGARNLTDPKTGWLNPATFAGMYKTLTEGVGKMPSYSTMSVEDRAALIHHMISLSADYAKPGADDVAKLEAEYQLSQPKKAPNQVPVKRAMEKMLKDAHVVEPAKDTVPVSVVEPATSEATHSEKPSAH